MSSFPLPIRIHEHDEIRLSDHTVLSAMIWLPEDAAVNPVPAILEYLPYRKRDKTAERDALNHPYVASHGYACVRVDMRGSGDSEGILRGEYLKQEQDDALEILQWIAEQVWCTGSIGIIGISWGGFNGLQVAARRPKELKAVISLCSTDDRYADDIHYMGGCLLVENFSWGATMFSITPTPPDPAVVGSKWRDLWMSRLEAGGNFMVEWHEHQRRDEFWRHASICEDYSAIQCPVYLVGGWADGYSNTIFRMLEHLKCPRKGLVGPWAHAYPNFATPGPQIGFLQESIRWWDKWLKGKETGIMDEPMLRCYLQDTVPPRIRYDLRPGHWVAENSWPAKDITPRTMRFSAGRLSDELSTSNECLSICSPVTVGFAGGLWYSSSDDDLPSDQRAEADGSLLFDTSAGLLHLDLLGAPVVYLRVASDKPNALVAAVLSEILPDGSATRISFGLLNLTHRNSHTGLEPLEVGRFYDVTMKLNDCGQRIGAGSCLRLALSTSYFPICWPSPEMATLTIDCAQSKLVLPTRLDGGRDSPPLRPFEPAVNGAPLKTRLLRPGKKSTNTVTDDVVTGAKTLCRAPDAGLVEFEATGWRYAYASTTIFSISLKDPLSARAEMRFKREYGREGLDLAVEGWNKMTASRTHFHLTARLEASENGVRVFGRDYSSTILRDHV